LPHTIHLAIRGAIGVGLRQTAGASRAALAWIRQLPVLCGEPALGGAERV
jgi:hypothetical protein